MRPDSKFLNVIHLATVKCLKDEWKTNLGWMRRVRLIEEWPDLWLRPLPPRQPALVVRVFIAKLASYILLARLVRLDVQLVENGQRGLITNKNKAIVTLQGRRRLYRYFGLRDTLWLSITVIDGCYSQKETLTLSYEFRLKSLLKSLLSLRNDVGKLVWAEVKVKQQKNTARVNNSLWSFFSCKRKTRSFLTSFSKFSWALFQMEILKTKV